MIKKTIAIAMALATIAAVCAAPASAADTTAHCYAACWSTDASGKAKVAPLGTTGEYAGWDEVLAAIRGHDVSGYADYRFGLIVGIDAERPYEIGGDAPGEAAPAQNPFADISEGDWFYDDVMYAYANRLMVGTSADPMLFGKCEMGNAKCEIKEDTGVTVAANPFEMP